MTDRTPDTTHSYYNKVTAWLMEAPELLKRAREIDPGAWSMNGSEKRRHDAVWQAAEKRQKAGEKEERAPYAYTECGLDNIFLLNGYEITPHEGDDYVSVVDVDGLHHAIGRHLVLHRKGLSPKEIRFLRKTMDKTQAEMAAKLGNDAQTVARWEKGICEIPGTAEKLLRATFLAENITCDDDLKLLKNLLVSVMDELDFVDEVASIQAQFTLKDHWMPADTTLIDRQRIVTVERATNKNPPPSRAGDRIRGRKRAGYAAGVFAFTASPRAAALVCIVVTSASIAGLSPVGDAAVIWADRLVSSVSTAVSTAVSAATAAVSAAMELVVVVDMAFSSFSSVRIWSSVSRSGTWCCSIASASHPRSSSLILGMWGRAGVGTMMRGLVSQNGSEAH